jgi:hypothetical protein
MRARSQSALLFFVALALAAGALATDVARREERGGRLRLELGEHKPTALAPATLQRFERLSERVLATYYVSAPERMPAEMRRMELEVGDLLAALRRRSPSTTWDPSTPSEARARGLTARSASPPSGAQRHARRLGRAHGLVDAGALLGQPAGGADPRPAPEQLPSCNPCLVSGWTRWSTARPAHRPGGARGFRGSPASSRCAGTTRVDLDGGEALPSRPARWMRPRAGGGGGGAAGGTGRHSGAARARCSRAATGSPTTARRGRQGATRRRAPGALGGIAALRAAPAGGCCWTGTSQGSSPGGKGGRRTGCAIAPDQVSTASPASRTGRCSFARQLLCEPARCASAAGRRRCSDDLGPGLVQAAPLERVPLRASAGAARPY